MATVAITAQVLTINTAGDDHPDAGSGTGTNGLAATAAHGWVVTPPSGQEFNERTFFRMSVTTAATFTFKGGDHYSSQRAGLGDMAIAMATNDSRVIAVETGRFLQSDQTILVTCTQATTDVLSCYMMPKGG